MAYGALAAFACLLTGGAAAKPASGTAQFTLVNGYRYQLATGATQTYTVFRGPECGAPPLVVKLIWPFTNSKRVKVTAGVPVSIEATTYLVQTTGVSGGYGQTTVHMDEGECLSSGSFIPEDGHDYEIKQVSDVKTCHIDVIDKKTGTAPPSFVAGKGGEFCWAFYEPSAPPGVTRSSEDVLKDGQNK